MPVESSQPLDISEQSNRLDVGSRNHLQAEIMRKLGLSSDEMPQWIDKYGQKISDIIDGQDEIGRSIRKLVRQGKIEQAAKMIIGILYSNN